MIFYLYNAPGMYPGRLTALVTGIRDVPGGYAVDGINDDGVRSAVYIGYRPAFVVVCPD